MNGNLNLSIETFRSCLSFNDKDPEALKNISKNLYFNLFIFYKDSYRVDIRQVLK